MQAFVFANTMRLQVGWYIGKMTTFEVGCGASYTRAGSAHLYGLLSEPIFGFRGSQAKWYYKLASVPIAVGVVAILWVQPLCYLRGLAIGW